MGGPLGGRRSGVFFLPRPIGPFFVVWVLDGAGRVWQPPVHIRHTALEKKIRIQQTTIRAIVSPSRGGGGGRVDLCPMSDDGPAGVAVVAGRFLRGKGVWSSYSKSESGLLFGSQRKFSFTSAALFKPPATCPLLSRAVVFPFSSPALFANIIKALKIETSCESFPLLSGTDLDRSRGFCRLAAFLRSSRNTVSRIFFVFWAAFPTSCVLFR